MIAWPQPTLQTDRLILRPFRISDASAVQRMAGAWEIADTTLLIPHPYLEGLAEKWIASHATDWQEGRSAAFGITLRETNELCGAIGLALAPQYARAELGYWIGVAFWNRGYCSEAVREVIRFGFEHLGLNRIYAHHFSRNPASGRVLRKSGMSYEGCLRQHVRRWERFEDLECYGILRGEWVPSSGDRESTGPGGA
ncbi:MAG: GNAT family N-acetyltransferase [Verrucomicrobiales bacterium]|nr:GNAT family N-acetyltransferase [Verrucomicrobiales bacterium]